MDKLACLLIILFAFSCTSPKDSSGNVAVEPAPADLDDYLESFESAILNHDSHALMSLLDKDYVKEQHDGFLNGRTAQFLKELFCGGVVDKDAYQCLKFESIRTIQKLNVVKDGENGYRVYCLISNDKYAIKANWFIKVLPVGAGQKFGLVGAVG